MLNPLLPRQIDNAFRGSRVALWVFGVLVLVKAVIGFNSIFHGYTVATTADGIALDTFSPPAARTAVVALFALLGVAHLTMCLLCIVVLVRYRSLVAFMFALLSIDFLARKLVLQFIPLERAGAAPGNSVSLVVLALLLVGLALSLWPRRTLRTQDPNT